MEEAEAGDRGFEHDPLHYPGEVNPYHELSGMAKPIESLRTENGRAQNRPTGNFAETDGCAASPLNTGDLEARGETAAALRGARHLLEGPPDACLSLSRPTR